MNHNSAQQLNKSNSSTRTKHEIFFFAERKYLQSELLSLRTHNYAELTKNQYEPDNKPSVLNRFWRHTDDVTLCKPFQFDAHRISHQALRLHAEHETEHLILADFVDFDSKFATCKIETAQKAPFVAKNAKKKNRKKKIKLTGLRCQNCASIWHRANCTCR